LGNLMMAITPACVIATRCTGQGHLTGARALFLWLASFTLLTPRS